MGVLGLHEVKLEDEMFNPFPTSETVSHYINFDELDHIEDNIPGVFDKEGNEILPTSLFELNFKI